MEELTYLFNWDKIPGDDNERLLNFLNQNYGIEWVKTAKIEKENDNKKIKITAEINAEIKSLWLTLNYEKTQVNLATYDGITDDLIAKTEKDQLNIYDIFKIKLEEVPNPIIRIGEHDLPYLKIETMDSLSGTLFGDFYEFSEKTYLLSTSPKGNKLWDLEKILKSLYTEFNIDGASGFMINQTCYKTHVNYSWFGFGPANFIRALKEQNKRYSEAGLVSPHSSEVAGFIATGKNFIFYVSLQPSTAGKNIEPTFNYKYAGFIFGNIPFNNRKFIDFFKKSGLEEPDSYKEMDLHLIEKDLPNTSFNSNLNKEGLVVYKRFPGVGSLSDVEKDGVSEVILENPFYGNKEIDEDLSTHKKIIVNLLSWHPSEEQKNYYLKKLVKISLPFHGFPLEAIRIYGDW